MAKNLALETIWMKQSAISLKLQSLHLNTQVKQNFIKFIYTHFQKGVQMLWDEWTLNYKHQTFS